MNKNQVTKFVELAKFPAINILSRCVDGRYEGLENFPMISKPGADAGDVMVTFRALDQLGVELPPEQILASVLEEVGGANNFQFHTDDHAEHDHAGSGMGCGHLKHAKNDPTAYKVKPEQMQFLMDALAHMAEQNKDSQVVLHGDHAEQAVIVVDSEHYGLKPLLRQGDEVQEAFVYQQTLHHRQLEKLAGILHQKIGRDDITQEKILEALKDAFGGQLTETLSRLAAGKPVYTVKINVDGAVEVVE